LFPDQGTVQKVVVLPTNFSASGELILEELEVFQVWLAPTFTLPMCMFTQTLCSKDFGKGNCDLIKDQVNVPTVILIPTQRAK